MVCPCGDPASFVSFLAWPPYAMAHGLGLFLDTRVQVPGGMNLLDNTSVLGLGVVLAPLTVTLGPIASLNVALTAAPALTAVAAYGCLRRALGLWRPAAFIGGLLLGFSPFAMRNEAIGHLQVTFLPLLPVIFLCCYELAVAQRGRWWPSGILLGVVVAVQFFVGLEALTITAVMTAGALVLALIAALARESTRAAVTSRLPHAWRGLLLGAVLAAVLLAYPLWFALAGPGHIHGADWTALTSNSLDRVLLPLGMSRGQLAALPKTGYPGPAGQLSGYFGIVALIVVLVAAVVVRRPLAKLCAVMTVVALWLSLGKGHAGGSLLRPWGLVAHLPLLDNVSPANFSIAAVWFGAVAGALLLDWAWRLRAASVIRVGAATAVCAALVVPWAVAWPLPYRTQPVTTPAPVATVLARLPAHAVVLFYPFPSSYLDQALVWQAQAGLRFAVVGGRGITAGKHGAADHGLTPGTPSGTMSALSTSYSPHSHLRLPSPPTSAMISSFRSALRRWGVTDIVLTSSGRDPAYARRWLAAVLGVAPQHQAGLWVWRNVPHLIS
jgi:hypothetical protein